MGKFSNFTPSALVAQPANTYSTSELIDDARSTTDKDERTALYEEAMSKVLDLAIELPVYQRSTVYVYNSKVIKASSLPSASEMNPYTSPLDKIWEIEFAD